MNILKMTSKKKLPMENMYSTSHAASAHRIMFAPLNAFDPSAPSVFSTPQLISFNACCR